MRIFGKQRSKWWLLSIPLAILLSPALLMLFFMGNNLAGAIFGPPAIWNRPTHPPSHTDVAGLYKESGRRSEQSAPYKPATLALNIDGSMTVTSLQTDTGFKTCILSGHGSWSGPDDNNVLDLVVQSDGLPGSCESDQYAFMQIASRSRPYRLYWILGDPDSGTGIWLKPIQK